MDKAHAEGAHHVGLGGGGGGDAAHPCPADPAAGVAGVHVGWGGSFGGGRGGAASEPQADEPAAPPLLLRTHRTVTNAAATGAVTPPMPNRILIHVGMPPSSSGAETVGPETGNGLVAPTGPPLPPCAGASPMVAPHSHAVQPPFHLVSGREAQSGVCDKDLGRGCSWPGSGGQKVNILAACGRCHTPLRMTP